MAESGEGSGGGVVAASNGGDVVVVGGRVIACRLDTLLLARVGLDFVAAGKQEGSHVGRRG